MGDCIFVKREREIPLWNCSRTAWRLAVASACCWRSASYCARRPCNSSRCKVAERACDCNDSTCCWARILQKTNIYLLLFSLFKEDKKINEKHFASELIKYFQIKNFLFNGNLIAKITKLNFNRDEEYILYIYKQIKNHVNIKSKTLERHHMTLSYTF